MLAVLWDDGGWLPPRRSACAAGSRATHTAMADLAVLRAVTGGGLYLGAVALFSLALATLIRHTAGAITAMTAIAFVVPTILVALPASWQDTAGRWLPANAGSAL